MTKFTATLRQQQAKAAKLDAGIAVFDDRIEIQTPMASA